ncbi:hypothetical protein M3Y94_01023300 [Aphelenchoides besseyi]|nr:hypothetical protein M3Y94_01023300 [Aphelenchoides besseyi]
MEILEVNSNRPIGVDTIFGVTMLVNYSIIIFCACRIRRLLRSGTVTSIATRRMNREMDRVLMFFAFYPLVSSILPSAYTTYSITTCDDYPWLGFVNSLWMNSPYRRTAREWLRHIGKWKSIATETSGTVTSTIQRRF